MTTPSYFCNISEYWLLVIERSRHTVINNWRLGNSSHDEGGITCSPGWVRRPGAGSSPNHVIKWTIILVGGSLEWRLATRHCGLPPPPTSSSHFYDGDVGTLIICFLSSPHWLTMLDSMMLMHWTVIKFLFVVHPLTHLIKRCHHWTCLIFLVCEISWMATFSGFICHISLKCDL